MSLNLLQWATRMSTIALVRRWVLHNRQTLTPRTHAHYTMVVWRFAECVPKNIKDLTVEHIERYLDSILKNYTRRTANAHLTAVKSFCRWAAENYDTGNPAAKIKMLKEDPPKRRHLSPEEYEKILNVCQDGEANIIRFLANTGLRASELQSLNPNNFSYDLKTIRFAGKGRKQRVAVLNETARSCAIKSGKPHLNFLKSYRKRNALFALCKRLSRKAGVPVAGPHSYRRFFATSLLNADVPIYKISKLLGHSDIRTTERYLAPECEDRELEGVTDCLDS